MGSIRLLVGAMAAGALIGVLFAPAKGSVTRRRNALQANTNDNEIQNTVEELIDTMTQRIESVRGDVAHLRRQLMRQHDNDRMSMNEMKKGADFEFT
jgi:gas vesicle protein